MRNRTTAAIRTLVTIAVTVTALTACGSQSGAPNPESSERPSSADPVGPFGEGDAPPQDDATVDAAPTASETSQTDAGIAATAVLAAFGRPQLDYDTWWVELLPRLTQQAGVAYEGTDPALIPVHRVTGAPVVLEGDTEVSLIVQIPTDVGLYNVTLTRNSSTAPWLADRIRPAKD